jgi:tryptophanyl-tRNA synthetase
MGVIPSRSLDSRNLGNYFGMMKPAIQLQEQGEVQQKLAEKELRRLPSKEKLRC